MNALMAPINVMFMLTVLIMMAVTAVCALMDSLETEPTAKMLMSVLLIWTTVMIMPHVLITMAATAVPAMQATLEMESLVKNCAWS
jgi:hypothetical protein